jgi:hypothetical protein
MRRLRILPRPSSASVFDITCRNQTLGEFSRYIRQRLWDNGYGEVSQFSAPGGFAIATRFEQFRSNLRSEPEPRRFDKAITYDWFTAHFGNQELGRHRAFVILVGDDLPIGGRADFDALSEVFQGNTVDLPPALRAMRLPDTSSLRIYLYRYDVRVAGVQPEQRFGGPGISRHLSAAGLEHLGGRTCA